MKTWTARPGQSNTSARGSEYDNGSAAASLELHPHVAPSPVESFPILSAGPRPPMRKVDEFYPQGVLSDDTAVAALRCGHLAYDLTEYREFAVCEWCPWS